MNYETADKLLQGRCKTARKVANNTWLHRIQHEDAIALRLHYTDILIYYPDGSFKVDTGGWHTHTTKSRLNEYLPKDSVYQKQFVWRWSSDDREFVDGELLTA